MVVFYCLNRLAGLLAALPVPVAIAADLAAGSSCCFFFFCWRLLLFLLMVLLSFVLSQSALCSQPAQFPTLQSVPFIAGVHCTWPRPAQLSFILL